MEGDKCLLCLTGKPYHIKSHLTPAGITENTYGERNKELIYTIDLEEKTVDKYYGPQYPQTETTEIKAAPNSRKGIFCKECETKFGYYEHEVQNKINDLVNSLGKGGYTVRRTQEGIKYLEVNIHPNILIAFFQSIIWRQCLEQILKSKDSPLIPRIMEELRKLVLNNISYSAKEIVEVDLSNNPRMAIFTSYYTALPDVSSYVNPHSVNSNPLLFFVGSINLLYWYQEDISSDFTNKTRIPQELLSENLQLSNSKIAIVNSGCWTRINSVLAKSVARKLTS